MKVKCIYTKGKDLIKFGSKNSSSPFLIDSKGRSLWCTENTVFGSLELGRVYRVMGQVIRDGLVHYVLDNGQVDPYILFEVVDNQVDSEWYFRVFPPDDPNYVNREALWGYYELCFDDNHFFQLLNKDENAMMIFFKRKIEME